MTKRTKVAAAAAAAATLVVASGGIAYAAGVGRDDDKPLTGSTLDRASEAALAHTNGGTVVKAEHGDDGSAYEVEVRRPDGSTVEVNLDASFAVVGSEADDDAGERGDDDDGAGDDD